MSEKKFELEGFEDVGNDKHFILGGPPAIVCQTNSSFGFTTAGFEKLGIGRNMWVYILVDHRSRRLAMRISGSNAPGEYRVSISGNNRATFAATKAVALLNLKKGDRGELQSYDPDARVAIFIFPKEDDDD